jgi:hypothetical protein
VRSDNLFIGKSFLYPPNSVFTSEFEVKTGSDGESVRPTSKTLISGKRGCETRGTISPLGAGVNGERAARVRLSRDRWSAEERPDGTKVRVNR